MREIKFRGKRVDNGEWVYGHYFVSPLTDENSGTNMDKGWYFLSDCVKRHCIEANGVSFVVDQKTVEQFTGLHDKNGKEIYEGDVVRITAFEDDGDVFIHRIYWDDVSASFKTYGRTDGWDMTVTPESTEVIGNIHENPELLEVSC